MTKLTAEDRADRAEHAGNITPQQEAAIKAKARAKLQHGKPTTRLGRM